MRILDGELVVFLGDSITQHLAAVNDWMETQTDGLPPPGAQVCVDRHEHGAGPYSLRIASTCLIRSAEYAMSTPGSGDIARGRC